METFVGILVLVFFGPAILWFILMPFFVALSGGAAAVEKVKENKERKERHLQEFEELKEESARMRKELDEFKAQDE